MHKGMEFSFSGTYIESATKEGDSHEDGNDS